MALARIKTWLAGDVLTAADLNAEFNNILNNPFPLINTMPSAAGDLFISTGANVWGRLAIGTSGQILQVSTGLVPIWGSGAAITGVSGSVSNAIALKGSSTGVYTATTSVFSTAATSVAAGFATSAVTLTSGNKITLQIVTVTTGSVIANLNEYLQFASSLITFGPWFRVNNGALTPTGAYTYFDAHTVTSSEAGAQTFNLELRGDGTNAMNVFNGSTATPESSAQFMPRGLFTVIV